MNLKEIVSCDKCIHACNHHQRQGVKIFHAASIMEKIPKKNIYVYIKLNHFAVHLKAIQHYKLTILQCKNWLKRRKKMTLTSAGHWGAFCLDGKILTPCLWW